MKERNEKKLRKFLGVRPKLNKKVISKLQNKVKDKMGYNKKINLGKELYIGKPVDLGKGIDLGKELDFGRELDY